MSLTYNAKILIRRGAGNPGTILDRGELGFDTSDNKLYVGTSVGSTPVGVVMDPSLITIFNTFLKETSLGPNFIWTGGFLDVSVVGGGGVSQTYVDGSLALRDVSILWLQNNKQNSGNYIIETSLGPQFYWQDGSLFVTDVSGITPDVTKSYVDGSLAERDSSIVWLNANKLESDDLYPYATNASVGLVVSTINASLNLKTDFTYDIKQDASIALKTDFTYDVKQDASIDLKAVKADVDASLGILNVFYEDLSTYTHDEIYSKIETDASFVFKQGDTMTGTLNVPDISSLKYLQFDTSVIDTSIVGRIHWNDFDKTLNIPTGVDDVVLQVGREELLQVYNKSGGPILNGQAVYIEDASGGFPSVALALAENTARRRLIGLATCNIADKGLGFVTTRGIVRGIDTGDFSEGDRLYLSSTTPGAYQASQTAKPNQLIRVGTVLVVSGHGKEGQIYVDPYIGPPLSQLSDVRVDGSENIGDILMYDGSTMGWNVYPGATKTYIDGSILILKAKDASIDVSINSLWSYELKQDASINISLDYTLGKTFETADRTIYVNASGNDFSGDGTSGNPYQTLYKAISTVGYKMNDNTVTIQVGAGSFIYDSSCDYLVSQRNKNGEIIIQGTTVTDVSNLVLYQRNPTTDPFTYDVSVSGVTPSWTTNQWRKYFVDTSAGSYIAPHPIANSSTWTLEIADPSSKNYSIIMHLDTSINLSETLYSGKITFRKVKLWLNDDVEFNETERHISWAVGIIGATTGAAKNITFTKVQMNISGTYFDCTTPVGTYNSNVNLGYSVIYGYSGTSAFFKYNSVGIIYNSIIFRDTVGGYGIQYTTGARSNPSGLSRSNTYHIKFKNISYPLFMYNGEFLYGENFKFYLENCPYLIRLGSGENTVGVSRSFSKFYFDGDIIGAPTTRYFYDSGTLFKKYYNPVFNDIHIKNVLYREIDNLNLYKVPNNSYVDVSIGHISQNKSISLSYTLQRGSHYAEGAFNLISDTSNLTCSVDKYISTGSSVDASALTFDAFIDSSIIKWRVTLDSSGGDASLNYSLSRVMKYPLTL